MITNYILTKMLIDNMLNELLNNTNI